MRRRKCLLCCLAAFLLTQVAAAFLTGPWVIAALRSDSQFLTLPADSRIRYEPGAETAANILAADLAAAIAAVEKIHGEKFARPVVIHVCASLKTFADFTSVPSAGGVVINERLFISPKKENTADRLPRVLRHELSHLHLSQKLGTSMHLRIPSWFLEGLAVLVSDGGGAESVSPADAERAIRSGRHFVVRESSDIIRQLTGRANDGLPQHLFYRQSGLFVAFMRETDPAAFGRLMNSLLHDSDFSESTRVSYGRELPTLWRDFIEDLSRRAR